jgi:hypothetical protein
MATEHPRYKHSDRTLFKQKGIASRERCAEQVVADYKEGKSLREISLKYEITQWLGRKMLQEAGVKTRTNSENKRQYTVNEHVFDDITDQSSAYHLGLLYADGHNNQKRGTIALTQNEDDIDVIVRFRDFVRSNQPILFYNDPRQGRRRTALIHLNSRHMSDRLAELGMVHDKTHKAEFPTISRWVWRHFIRGVFDGDGSISIKNNRRRCATVSFTGTESLCTSIGEILKSEAGISDFRMYTRHPERKNNIRMIHISRTDDVLKSLHWMYDDNTVYMKRKAAKAFQFYKACQ